MVTILYWFLFSKMEVKITEKFFMIMIIKKLWEKLKEKAIKLIIFTSLLSQIYADAPLSIISIEKLSTNFLMQFSFCIIYLNFNSFFDSDKVYIENSLNGGRRGLKISFL